ncbi:unnamed protein product [Arabidopsis thaliana]|uniref:Cytochrome C oxidase polypeptide VIB family protein n=2 Tax=Arabidopsis thaliana TaxID=3702 RepID=O22965_ARATH|nr:Cytochrome C oxidase polypeptide VIB family protein [Arabidopsis thaliana]AAB67630.1 hypothetical protein [Arabidopsis thaliana]AEC08921.1 Cytochrome C oxidase polypeptide VIB family protein [Arabidopsis thaliana]VYS54388.1 unnamed protein product [Arabidopsis thaliana]|eukprot:NP_180959.1 Cytochrome C oxidase polypeptide VIB family protein [Arabidopsis thaliana]
MNSLTLKSEEATITKTPRDYLKAKSPKRSVNYLVAHAGEDESIERQENEDDDGRASVEDDDEEDELMSSD